MNKELKSIVKKSAKIAGVTCIAAGAVALMTSGAALKAITEGGKYLIGAVKKIASEAPEAEQVVSEAAQMPKDAPMAEAAAFEEAVSQEVSAAEENI